MAYFWLKAINQLLNLLIPLTKLKLFTIRHPFDPKVLKLSQKINLYEISVQKWKKSAFKNTPGNYSTQLKYL